MIIFVKEYNLKKTNNELYLFKLLLLSFKNASLTG